MGGKVFKGGVFRELYQYSWVHWVGLVEQGVIMLCPTLHYQGPIFDEGRSVSRSNRCQGACSRAVDGLDCILETEHVVLICISLDFVGFQDPPLISQLSQSCLGLRAEDLPSFLKRLG